MRLIFAIVVYVFYAISIPNQIHAQMDPPDPCGENPQMTSFCADACVICNIDGFTGVNDLTASGQGFPEFCTTQYNNMQYIAFIAGSENITVEVEVGTCQAAIPGITSLEVGFFYTEDCENFEAIAFCDTDIEQNTSTVFTNDVPLVVGQHYYLVIDGSGGANCFWTFSVLEGSTEVFPIDTSGVITHIEETCPNFPTNFSTTGDEGAAIFEWRIDGVLQAGNTSDVNLEFPNEGVYEVCVIAANACDEGPPSCTTIKVREIENLSINEVLCDGECVEANGNQYCATGIYQEIITLPNGCDSIIDIDITVLPQPQSSPDLWICNTDSFFIGDVAYNETGSYTGVVLTENNCDSLVFLELLVIECDIIGSADSIPVICNGGSTGTLIFSVDQGEPPLTYVYTNIFDTSITGTGQTNLLVDNEIPNIAAGTYQIFISDNFGNQTVVLQDVTEAPVIEIEMIAQDYDGFNVSCFEDINGDLDSDGIITANVTGGALPYSYLWSNGSTDNNAQNLPAGNHSVIVSDAYGCNTPASLTLVPPPAINANVVFNDPTCNGFDTGIIDIQEVTGGSAPYSFSLENNSFSNDTLFENLTEGTYQVYIQDDNNCVTFVESSITAPDIPVIELDDLTIFLGDSIEIIPSLNETSIANILWTNEESLECNDCLDPFARPVNSSSYTLTVTSEDDCTDSESMSIFVTKRRRVYVPNIFSPDNDGINEFFFVNAGPEADLVVSFSVLDRWGNLIFQAENTPINDSSQGWDGKFKGDELNPGSYVWVAEVGFIDGVVEKYSGTISLIR